MNKLNLSCREIINRVLPILNTVAALIVTVFYFSPAYSQEAYKSMLVDYASVSSVEDLCKGSLAQTYPQERLNCFWENGYPYARVCSYMSLSSGSEICTGPFIIIDAFTFSEELLLDEALFQELGEFYLWQPYNHSQVLAFLAEIERRLGVVDAQAVFEQTGPGSVGMIVDGSVPRSSLSGGLFTTQSNTVQFGLSGRHYQSPIAPGFLNYDLFYEPTNGTSGGSASLPLGVSRSGLTTLHVQADDIKRHQYDSETVRFGVRIQRDVIEPITIFTPTRLELDFTSSELITNFDAIDKSSYVTLSSLWARPGDNNDLELSLKSYLQDDSNPVVHLSFNSSAEIVNPSTPFLRWFINSTGQKSLGPVEGTPPLERIYLGGANLRGYSINEIGTEPSSLSEWGGELALTLQIDALAPILPISNNFLVGLHADTGYFEPSVGAGSLYSSYGVAARYQFGDQVDASASFSINDRGRSSFSLSFQLN